jgi:hypothetical protein
MAKYPYQNNCEHCAAEFTISQSRQKTKRFCSTICNQKSRQKHYREEACLQCAEPLTRGKFKFCSQSCSATFNNTQRGAHSLERKTKIREGVYRKNNKTPNQPYDPEIRKCLKCNQLCKQRGTKYCSIACANSAPKPHKTPPSVFNCSCAHCGLKFTNKTQKKYCSEHAVLYSHNGRARYWFSINVYKYPDLFDLESLTRVGFRSRINPNGYTRDHRVSVNEAIKNNYDSYYIKHVMNCELMLWEENNKKNTKSSIAYQELVKLVDDYDSRHQPPPPDLKQSSSPPSATPDSPARPPEQSCA